MAVTPTDPPILKTQYPHVDDIEDWRAQQTTRLLWERVFALDARLQAAEGTVGDLVSASNQHETQLTRIDHKADEALATAALTASEKQAIADAGTGTKGGGKDDLGLGAAGCEAAGATGHLTGTFEKTVTNAGKIVCGVGNEFPALLAATPTFAARQANRAELLNRMIWHLNQAGFSAAHYGTPGTDEATFNILFDALALDGSAPVRQYAYRVTTYDPVPPSPWDTTHTIETCMVCSGQTPGTTTPPDAGTAD